MPRTTLEDPRVVSKPIYISVEYIPMRARPPFTCVACNYEVDGEPGGRPRRAVFTKGKCDWAPTMRWHCLL